MSIDTFTLTCARGHDRVTLTGQDAIEHGEACAGRKVGRIWTDITTPTSGWSNSPDRELRTWKPCRDKVKPVAWRAPAWKPFNMQWLGSDFDLIDAEPSLDRRGTVAATYQEAA